MILGIAVAAILLTAILVLSVRIQEVTVSGSSRYSAKQVEELLFSGRLGKNRLCKGPVSASQTDPVCRGL